MFIGNTVQSSGVFPFTCDGIALELIGGIKISSGTNKPIFTHITTAANIELYSTKLSYPNQASSDFLMVTCNNEVGPIANPHPLGVYFDGTV